MTSTIRRAVVTAILPCVLAVLGGCATSHSPERVGSPSPVPSDQRQAIEFAKLKIPADAQGLQVYTQPGGINRLVLLRFAIKRTEREAFLAGSGLARPQPGLNPIQANLGPKANWRLEQLTSYEGTRETGDPVREVLIDTSHSSTLTIYVAAFST